MPRWKKRVAAKSRRAKPIARKSAAAPKIIVVLKKRQLKLPACKRKKKHVRPRLRLSVRLRPPLWQPQLLWMMMRIVVRAVTRVAVPLHLDVNRASQFSDWRRVGVAEPVGQVERGVAVLAQAVDQLERFLAVGYLDADINVGFAGGVVAVVEFESKIKIPPYYTTYGVVS